MESWGGGGEAFKRNMEYRPGPIKNNKNTFMKQVSTLSLWPAIQALSIFTAIRIFTHVNSWKTAEFKHWWLIIRSIKLRLGLNTNNFALKLPGNCNTCISKITGLHDCYSVRSSEPEIVTSTRTYGKIIKKSTLNHLLETHWKICKPHSGFSVQFTSLIES